MTRPIRDLIRLVESASTEIEAQLHEFIERLAVKAKSGSSEAWIRTYVPQDIADYGGASGFFARPERVDRFTKTYLHCMAILDRHRPNDVEGLDISDVLKLEVPALISKLEGEATSEAVRAWVRTAIPKHIERTGTFTVLMAEDGERNWPVIYQNLIRFLNQRPPGNPDTPVEKVLDAVKNPTKLDRPTRLRGRIDTPAFKAWFGASKVVDHLGHPLVVFRGTRRPGDGEDTVYDTKLNTPSFTSSPDIASVYSSHAGIMGTPTFGKGSTVGAYYLSIQKPLTMLDAQVKFDDVLYQIDPGVTHYAMAADRIIGILENLKEMQEGGRAFQIELPGTGWFESDLDEVIERLNDTLDEPEAFGEIVSEITVDSYALADSEELVGWAMEKGFDGIIHRDVFGGGGLRAAHGLLGKTTDDVHGLDRDEYDDDAEPTHLTYRPFHQTQIKAVFNKGTWDSKKDHVTETHEGAEQTRTTPVTPAELTAAINATIKEFVGKKARCKTVRDIGSGYCYDFVERVFERLGASHDYLWGEGPSGLKTCATEDYGYEDFRADVGLLRQAGERIPRDIPKAAFENLIGGATHMWIKLGDLYYDATAPQGVPRFLELPFFADQIEGLRREIMTKRAAKVKPTRS